MIKNNRQIKIATAGTRKATAWPTSILMWSDFVDRLKTPQQSQETLQEYMAFPKAKQDDLKDVGGFVGGAIKNGGRRLSSAIEGRDLVTLDLDNIPTGYTDGILKRVGSLGCAAAVYSTRKHSDYRPRLRVIIPLSRTATADEYEPIARKLADMIGITYADPTTFEAHRLMYWPSCCSDSEYVYKVFDAAFCNPDGILAKYIDWHDIASWPQIPGAEAIEKRRLAKQENPLAKHGIVGAFCKAYTITEAMEAFIPGMYEPTEQPGRYTFTGGSTAGGAIVYDGDLFLFSHHATDPCSGQLVNAFDLIRLHMYGDKDEEAKPGTPVAKMPSYLAMKALASGDSKVKAIIAPDQAGALDGRARFGLRHAGHVGDLDHGRAGGEVDGDLSPQEHGGARARVGGDGLALIHGVRGDVVALDEFQAGALDRAARVRLAHAHDVRDRGRRHGRRRRRSRVAGRGVIEIGRASCRERV